MVAWRRPLIIALLIGAGITTTVTYRRLTAVTAVPPASSERGALDRGLTTFAALHGPVMQAGLFQMPLLSLSDMRSVPRSAMGPIFASLPSSASLIPSPDRSDDVAMPDDVDPPGLPIHDGMKDGATAWPEVMRGGKGDLDADPQPLDDVAHLVSAGSYLLLPPQGAVPMARLSRKLQGPASAEGLEPFRPTRMSAALATRLAQRFARNETRMGGADGAVPLYHSLAPAGGTSPAASRPDLASLERSATHAEDGAPVEMALAGPEAGEPVITLASVHPTTPDGASPMPDLGDDEGLTEAQKKSRIAGLPGLDDGKARPLDLPPVAFTRAQTCLATAIYFEARGESREGQVAVAQVVINRLRSPFYPKNVCDVVYQGASNRRYGGCQFSFACDGVADRITEKEPWEQALTIAARVMNAQDWIPEIGNATHYHADYVRPRWVRDMTEKDRIGKHIFYRVKWWA
ncbi:cell wall hydrolase [Labrys monachus]|uniref:Cell wall hydrolase SleB domain-containing protein n=1 Tax=Labrys monachus TaxID=217067 RepID=A0ABU0FAM7_9HYPH|nr:cell wall hydrolase [Labrys monachus]MDQ0391672.1 hypothetical protein [Labrys monachus]